MAPTPTDNNLNAEPSSPAKEDPGYWTKANIAVTIVFALLALAIVLALLAFFLHRKKQERKHSKTTADKAGLLDNEDRTSMFSRNRESSVTLYVDSEADAQSKRASQETTSLIALTPVEERRDPMYGNTGSAGSGVSAMSRTTTNTNNNTLSSMMLSPVSPNVEEGDLGIRPSGRPRSTSTSSQKARYYETTPTNVEMPPIPKIIRTPSDDEIRR